MLQHRKWDKLVISLQVQSVFINDFFYSSTYSDGLNGFRTQWPWVTSTKINRITAGIEWLTHWSLVTHTSVGKLTIIDSDNGLSPGRRQAIIWTNAGILLIEPIRTNFEEILIEIHIFSFKKMHLKMSSGKWRPFCLGLNVFIASANTSVFQHCI